MSDSLEENENDGRRNGDSMTSSVAIEGQGGCVVTCVLACLGKQTWQ